MQNRPVIIGTRGSELARTQTGMMAEAVARLLNAPVETLIIKTAGDRIQDVPLHLVDGKGFFTKEIEDALLDGRIDLAVHSLKDLPTDCPAGLTLAAIPAREMANDLLLVREDAVCANDPYLLPPNPVVGTSSKRRALQIKALHPAAIIKELRGNVPTRVAKLMDGQYDAILIAAAGFRRLSLEPKGYRALTLGFDAMLPAPGQGALALEIRAEDTDLLEALKPLHDANTALAVETERRVLDLLGGGCGMPLGVYAEVAECGIAVSGALGPDHWQLQDAPQMARGQARGETPDAAARALLAALGVTSA